MDDHVKIFRLSREFLILIPLFLAFWTLAGLNGIRPTRVFADYLLCGLCLWGWYRYFTTAYHVEVRPDGMLVSRTFFTSSVTAVRDIISIKETVLFIELEHDRGKILLSTLSDRIGGLKTLLLELNPEIRTKDAYYHGFKWK